MAGKFLAPRQVVSELVERGGGPPNHYRVLLVNVKGAVAGEGEREPLQLVRHGVLPHVDLTRA